MVIFLNYYCFDTTFKNIKYLFEYKMNQKRMIIEKYLIKHAFFVFLNLIFIFLFNHMFFIYSRNSNQSLSLEFDPDAKLLKCQCNSCQSTSVNWFKNAKLLPNQQAVMNQLQLEDIFEINGK